MFSSIGRPVQNSVTYPQLAKQTLALCVCVFGIQPKMRPANSTVMVARNPAFRQKAPGIRGGVWGEAPRFCLFCLFFPVKIT
jgi:hypothetical protein